MYYPLTDTPALCRTSSLVEELGQIEYIFSDKTGTLTRNEMEFRQCSIGGVPYADIVEESKKGEIFSFAEMRANLTGGHETAGIIDEFLMLLATCHTVIPEMKDNKIIYQASSPDEAALVAGAELLGYRFTVRSPVLAATLTLSRHESRSLSLSRCSASRRSTRCSTSASSTVRASACPH